MTGIIYAAIVVAWAVFLVPLALRSHDRTARNRSIERFSSTMRVLSAGGRRVGSRVVVSPPREADRVVSPTTSGRDTMTEDTNVTLPPPSNRAALRAAAARRRRVLRVLVALTLVTAAVSVLGAIPIWSSVIPLVLIVAFLGLARRQVRIADESYWQRAADAHSGSSNVVRRSAARVDASHGAARSEQSDGDEANNAPDGRDPADDEPTVTLTQEQLASAAADLEQERLVAVSIATADGSSLWDPLPITLPTYVDKPVARRSVRRVTLGESGTWSAGHAAEASRTADSTQLPDTVARGDAAASRAPDDSDSAEADDGPRAANA